MQKFLGPRSVVRDVAGVASGMRRPNTDQSDILLAEFIIVLHLKGSLRSGNASKLAHWLTVQFLTMRIVDPYVCYRLSSKAYLKYDL